MGGFPYFQSPDTQVSTMLSQIDNSTLTNRENSRNSATTARPLQHPLTQNRPAWLLASLVFIWLTFTLTFAWRVSSTTSSLGWFAPSAASSTELTKVLRILSEGISLFLAGLIATSTRIIKWAAASTRRGITFSTWLGMSTATGHLGLWKLFWWKRNNQVALDLHHLWIIVR
jgi:hypothetical protein